MRPIASRGCLFYGLGFFFGIPLLLALVGFLVIAGRERAAKRKLDDRLQKIVAQGLPVDNETMLSFTNSLTSKEDTKDWLAALGELTSEAFSKSTDGVPIFDPKATDELIVPAAGQTWSNEKVTRDFLTKWKDLFSRVSRLSLKQLEPGTKPVRFLKEFDSLNTLLPQTQNMRTAARLLLLNGQVAVFDRNSAKTRTNIEALLGCSRTVSGEPLLVSQLVCVSIEGMGVGLLRSALEQDVLSERDLMALLPRMLDGINISPQWKLAMQGERAMILPLFEHPELINPNLRWLPGRNTDSLHFLDLIDQVMEVPDTDLDGFRAGLAKVEQDFRRNFEGNLFQKFDSVVTTLTTPAVSSMGGAYIRDAMQRRAAAIAIGIRLYEKRNGRMPASLEDLKSLELGELKLNPAGLLPLGGKPFGYKVEDKQALLWGFDPNQASSTPAEPPSTADGSPNAIANKRWTWTLEKATSQ
ncbi:MAG: hypothetical protein SFV81_03535 [Pirellulaceae bacterium]|nr:hypothetical protein [Pirellulaceae bacterium]